MSRRVAERRQERESPVSVRIERALREAIQIQARKAGKPVSWVIRELLDMAVRMQRFPGIVFVDGPAGRRARLAGTGLDVWEVIELLREFGSVSALCQQFPRLSPMAVQIAQAYAEAYPEEITAFLALNARTPEQLRRQLPWLQRVRP
ncbi:MAG: DUF433 domain-containing protein [Candidatus Kerfeldbacteria bacterium]|nr:DUF433 domain-containing protein [Candidatus Kerfeldbacteria bacterium]